MTDSAPPPPPPADSLNPFQRQLLAVLEKAWSEGRKIVGEAYEAGRVEGRKQATVELRQLVAGVLGPATAETEAPSRSPSPPAPEGDRAPRGSVRPMVLAALAKLPQGGRPADIAKVAGVNENSARGMLNKLAEEGKTYKVGERWLLRSPPPPIPPPPPI